MANETRLHYSFHGGRLTNNPLAMGALTINSNELIDFPTVDERSYAAISVDPTGVNPEIMWIIDHEQGQPSATVIRGRENTSPQQHDLNTRWVHGPTAYDHDYPKSPMTRTFARAIYR